MNFLDAISALVKRTKPEPYRVWPSRKQAGVIVDEDSALTHAAVWGCVRIISETIASLPWRAHQRMERGNQILDNSPLDYLLHIEANPEQSAFSMRETMLSHALLWGNGYAEIERNNRGEAWNLWPIAPDKIRIDRTDDGKLWCIVNGQPTIPASEVFHLKGLGFDGLTGYSIVKQASRSIGLGIALDEMANSTFANGATPGGYIQQKEGKTLTQEGVKNLLDAWDARFKGPANGSKIGYLDAGMEFHTTSLPMDDIQFLESRKFQVSEIARWFRVPPHKLADLERATFSNIEHQALEFVTDTLVPWISRLETEAQIKLIGRNNRMGRVYTRINVAGLLRGDLQSRYSAYATARQWGWMSANDVRELEDMNPIPGGDDYLAPLNMAPMDMLRDINEPKEPPDPVGSAAADAPDTTDAPDAPDAADAADPSSAAED